MMYMIVLLQLNFIGVIYNIDTDATCFRMLNNTHCPSGKYHTDVSTYTDCLDTCSQEVSCRRIAWVNNMCYEGFHNTSFVVRTNSTFLEKIDHCNNTDIVHCQGMYALGGAIIRGISSTKGCRFSCLHIINCSASSWHSGHCYFFSSQPTTWVNHTHSFYFTKLSTNCQTVNTGMTESTPSIVTRQPPTESTLTLLETSTTGSESYTESLPFPEQVNTGMTESTPSIVTTQPPTVNTGMTESTPSIVTTQPSTESTLTVLETSTTGPESYTESLPLPGQVMYGYYHHVMGTAPKSTLIPNRRSRINCAVQCTKDYNCQGFDYNVNHRICVLRTGTYEYKKVNTAVRS